MRTASDAASWAGRAPGRRGRRPFQRSSDELPTRALHAAAAERRDLARPPIGSPSAAGSAAGRCAVRGSATPTAGTAQVTAGAYTASGGFGERRVGGDSILGDRYVARFGRPLDSSTARSTRAASPAMGRPGGFVLRRARPRADGARPPGDALGAISASRFRTICEDLRVCCSSACASGAPGCVARACRCGHRNWRRPAPASARARGPGDARADGAPLIVRQQEPQRTQHRPRRARCSASGRRGKRSAQRGVAERGIETTRRATGRGRPAGSAGRACLGHPHDLATLSRVERVGDRGLHAGGRNSSRTSVRRRPPAAARSAAARQRVGRRRAARRA
jgi:hypothetical protein